MDNKSRKRKLSVVSAQHYFRLSYRLVLFGILLVVYIRDKMDHGGTLMNLMDGVYKEGSWIMKNKNCPIFLMSGEQDPCMGNEKNFMRSVDMFKKQGYKNVSYVLYPGQRHEIYNDTNKETAMQDLLDFMLKAI